MPAPLRPAAALLFGRRNLIYVPTIASATLAPTVAEATASSGLDITDISFAGGAPAATMNTNRVSLDRRFGDTAQYEAIGTTQHTGGEITMALSPQAATGTDGKKAWEKFAAGGVTGYLLDRMAVAKATDLAAGQFVNILPVEFGPFMPVAQGEGESAEAAMTGSFAITGPPAWLKAILT